MPVNYIVRDAQKALYYGLTGITSLTIDETECTAVVRSCCECLTQPHRDDEDARRKILLAPLPLIRGVAENPESWPELLDAMLERGQELEDLQIDLSKFVEFAMQPASERRRSAASIAYMLGSRAIHVVTECEIRETARMRVGDQVSWQGRLMTFATFAETPAPGFVTAYDPSIPRKIEFRISPKQLLDARLHYGIRSLDGVRQ